MRDAHLSFRSLLKNAGTSALIDTRWTLPLESLNAFPCQFFIGPYLHNHNQKQSANMKVPTDSFIHIPFDTYFLFSGKAQTAAVKRDAEIGVAQVTLKPDLYVERQGQVPCGHLFCRQKLTSSCNR